MELTQPRRGGGAGPCRATVPPHRVCRVTRGRRCVVLCCVVLCCVVLCCLALDSASLTLLSRSHDDDLCPLCHHDIRGGGGGRWHGTQCIGSCTRVIGTCVTCVTCAGRATMTWRGGGGGAIGKCTAARAVTWVSSNSALAQLNKFGCWNFCMTSIVRLLKFRGSCCWTPLCG